jgi:transcriptional regulator with XRE-family HTH domain
VNLPKTIYKTLEQIEFGELLEKLKKLGCSQADVAREIHVSRQAISMYIKGTSGPSPRTLAGMRTLLDRLEIEKSAGEKTLERRYGSLDELHQQLEFLERHDPSSFEAARAAIGAFYRNVSSKSLSSAEEQALAAASSAKNLALKSERKQKAESPSRDKPGPEPGAGGPFKVTA